MKEIWKDVDGYEGKYRISNYGRVLSVKFNKYIYGRITKAGYLRVALIKNSIAIDFVVHRLVATHFISNLENKETVNHKDGNKLNNHIENLEWTTILENIDHAFKTGLRSSTGERNCKAKLTQEQVLQIKKWVFPKYKKRGHNEAEIISKKFNISISQVFQIRSGRSWKHLSERKG